MNSLNFLNNPLAISTEELTSAPFSACKTVINGVFVDEANHTFITRSIDNLIEYSDNYSDTSGSLWHFKRDAVRANNANLTIVNSDSFKYNAALVRKTANHDDGKSSVKVTKLAVPQSI